MYKKLMIINVAVILLVTAVYIFGYYFINYPMKFNIWKLIKECQLQYLPAVFGVTLLGSYLVSSLNFQRLNFKSKFLSVFPFLNTLALVFFIYISSEGFIKNKRALTKQENQYIREAEKDIKRDQIMMRYAGGLSFSLYNQTTTHKIDSIGRKYGIVSQTGGCTFDPIDHKAQEKYNEMTNTYLEKRNGKDWKGRMKKEIDGVKKIKNPDTE